MHRIAMRAVVFAAAALAAAATLGLAPAFAQDAAKKDAGKAAKQAPAKAAPAGSTALKSQKEKVSYAIGLDIGRNFKNQSVDVDPNILARGMRDAMSGAKPLMTEEEVRETMVAFQVEMRMQQSKKNAVQAEKNVKDGEAFLSANKSKDGVKTTATGLQYKVLKDGTGKSPTLQDTVTAHYRGTLIDGTEFDSSYKRGEPASFPVGGVIPGWTEALQMMKVGSKWQVWIPSALGYGERGAGGTIGPNATLIFEIELINVE